ncbi:major capsid protein [Pseudanabaena phage Pam4]|nr:major capsid protein [Pseudanabaena phage Pam4]
MDDETTTNLPEDLTSLTSEDLDAALSAARDESRAIRETDTADLTDEQVDRLEALADYADAVQAERDTRAAAAEERAARAEAASQRLDGGDGEPEGDDDAPANDAPAQEESTEEAAPEAVAASATRAARGTPMPRRAARNPEPARTGEGVFSLVAAADIGGRFTAGQRMADFGEVAEAFVQRSKGFPKVAPRGQAVRHQHNVAQITRDFSATTDALYVGNRDYASAQAVLEAAAKESRLAGGSLVAAGGWCAPSETLYGMVADETLDGILDLPTVGVDRGGINYTPGPDFQDIYTGAGFIQTEAQAIAGTTKNCVEIDCPDFSEVRLDAVGICVKAPLLTMAAYPELVRRWLEGTTVANEHKVNASVVTAMRTALGTALAPTLTGVPVAWGLLSTVEFHIEMERQAYRLSETQALEVILPRWARAAIRADLANRNGVGAERITNAQIAEHFADRGAAVQFILGYQEIATPLTAVAYPATVEVMVYPAGTFVKGTADVISLDTVYDTADLVTNVATAAFVEDGVLVAKMGHGGARLTLPVNITGQTGAADLTVDLLAGA